MKTTQFKKLFYQLSKKEQREIKELVAGFSVADQVERGGEKFEGYNKPKRTPNHPTKSHAVLAKEGDQVKLIRFGEQGAKTAGKPKEGESEAMKKKRAAFKARHAENIKKGKMSAAYWANKVKW
jgi:hypothetical protein